MPPNSTDDSELQTRLSLPPLARDNPWTNLLAPPIATGPGVDDDSVLARVRSSNYFDADGGIALARTLDALPREWDDNGNGRWDGFRPDAWFSFDEHGFDRAPDGSFTGWRAFAYYPLPGAFLPTNGSFDDTLIRLDVPFRQDAAGHFDARVYAVNFAIVEALILRHDVPIDATDERTLGVDLDLDGRLGTASRVAYAAPVDKDGTTRMHYVGHAREEQTRAALDLAPGFFPRGTEFLHTVRYLDIGPDGAPRMAARMKEVRYARKVRWSSYATARALAAHEAREQDESIDGVHEVAWTPEAGVFTRGQVGCSPDSSRDATDHCARRRTRRLRIAEGATAASVRRPTRRFRSRASWVARVRSADGSMGRSEICAASRSRRPSTVDTSTRRTWSVRVRAAISVKRTQTSARASSMPTVLCARRRRRRFVAMCRSCFSRARPELST